MEAWNVFVLLLFFKPVWADLRDLVTEMGCVTATGLAGGTDSAAATTVTKGSSASTASTATSAK